MITLSDVLSSFGGTVVADQGDAVWSAREACASPASPSLSKGDQLRRRQFVWLSELKSFFLRVGEERVLIGTVTVPDNIAAFDEREIRRRWKNFDKDMSSHYPDGWAAVIERSGKGRLHLHFVACAAGDVKTTFPWHHHDSKKRGRYPGVSQFWRDEKNWLTVRARAHGFGRCEITPLRKTGEAAAVYLSKYLSKPVKLYKGARSVSYSKRWQRCATLRFSWCNRTRCTVQALLSDYISRLRSVGLAENFIQARLEKIRRQAIVAFSRNRDVSYVDWVARVVGWDGHELPAGYVFGRLPGSGDDPSYGGMSVAISRSGGWWEFASFHDADYPVGYSPPWEFQKPLHRTVCAVQERRVVL